MTACHCLEGYEELRSCRPIPMLSVVRETCWNSLQTTTASGCETWHSREIASTENIAAIRKALEILKAPPLGDQVGSTREGRKQMGYRAGSIIEACQVGQPSPDGLTPLQIATGVDCGSGSDANQTGGQGVRPNTRMDQKHPRRHCGWIGVSALSIGPANPVW
jgi:hypothetical protein